jgi:hypothetical protein
MKPKISSTALFVAGLAPFNVWAGAGGDINLVNFTPYDWELKYSHSYRMKWDPSDIIPSGTNYKQYVEYSDWRDDGDCAAEAIYELVGSPYPASFTVLARQTHGKRIQIQYHDHLSSLGIPENSSVDLGFDWDGGVLFMLSGDGARPYIGSNPPIAWMQATLPTIGEKPLREISMPLSHDSGMSEISARPWFSGVWHNTCTQDATLGEQLQYGARWFDIRPFSRNGEWFTGHFSVSIGNNHIGGAGRSIDNIVHDINTFTSQNPGEFIVLELTHELLYEGKKLYQWSEHFEDDHWLSLYDKLAQIEDLWAPSNEIFKHLPCDLTTVPMTTFIQPGSKSVIIIRIPNHAPSAIGSAANAFIHENRLVWTGSYSKTTDPSYLLRDQLKKLTTDRTSRNRPLLRSTWTITQNWKQATNVASWKTSIIGLSYLAQRVLMGNIWDHLNKDTYPNLVEVDNLHNSQVAVLCMAINDRYANWKGVGGQKLPESIMSRRRRISPC